LALLKPVKRIATWFAILAVAAGLLGRYAIMDSSMTEHHPFRSAEAKERFLEAYDKKALKWPVASEARVVETSYGPTHVRISGPKGAAPLVLLHGIGGSSLHWIPNIQELSAGFRTYAVDTINDNGRSVSTRPIENHDDYVKWLDELFTGLKLGNDINIVGMSYGGWMATRYALSHPERTGRLVLLAPAGTVLQLRFGFISRAVMCLIPHRYFTKRTLYWLLEDMAKKDEHSLALLEEEVDFAYLAIRSFKPHNNVNPAVLDDKELNGIQVPTLYMVGENEKIYSAHEAVERLNRVAPRIRTEVIADTGHDLTITQAKLVNRKILEFLTAS